MDEAATADRAFRRRTAARRVVGLRGAKTLRNVFALMLREIATARGRGPGGYLWEIVEPVAVLGFFTLAFSFVFTNPPLGQSFALFHATGYLPFMTFLGVSSALAATISFSRPLLGYPVVTILDALLARFLLCLLTEAVVAIIVFGGIILLFDLHPGLDPPRVLLAFGLAAASGAGFGLMMCWLGTAFPLAGRLWQIGTRPLFVVSGIFFTFDSLPKDLQQILWFNPLIHVVGVMREGFYPGHVAAEVSLAWVLCLSMLTGMIGLFFLSRHHRDLIRA